MFSFSDVAVSLRKISQWKFDVNMEQSPLLVVLKIVDSLFSPPFSPGSSSISGRDPLLVVLYCNSPVFTKIKKNCFRCELFGCLICLRCLHPRFINRRLFFPLLSRTGRRPTLATMTLAPCDIGFRPITVAKTARDQPQPTERKPRLIIKRDIFIARRKVFLERFQREVNAADR